MTARGIVLAAFAFAMSVGTLVMGQAAGSGGEGVYDANCRRCHGPEGRGGKAPSLVPFNWSDQEALRLVREPECDMPPFSTSELSDEDVAEIVAYLKTLK